MTRRDWSGRAQTVGPLIAAVLVAVALVLAAGCGPQDAAGGKFTPREPGTLTVATATLPAPGLWGGERTDADDGFEAALALELAGKLGLDHTAVIQVPFGDIVAGRLGDADIALSQITPTAARDDDADFTSTYLSVSPGVLVRDGVDVRDEQGLQELRWVVLRGSTLTDVVRERIRPDRAPREVSMRDAGLGLIRAGAADAMLLDLPVAQGLARAEPQTFHAAGQLPGREGIAVVLPDGSPNREAVDSALRGLVADGTVDDLAERWLGNPDDVPLIRVSR